MAVEEVSSFRREKYVPKGGPDGGDGGKGGDVLISGRMSLISLLDFKYKRIYRAENGNGGGRQKRPEGTEGTFTSMFPSAPRFGIEEAGSFLPI